MKYFEALTHKMKDLADIPNTIFLGQAVKNSGTIMYNTLKDLPNNKTIEMPVAENMQLGMSIGLSLQGYLPISIFPRWNFLLSATDQLINHLDKISEISNNEFNPKVIIRVGVGSEEPLYPGPQHVGNFSDTFRSLLKNINVVELFTTEDIVREYNTAIRSHNSTILVEFMDKYN